MKVPDGTLRILVQGAPAGADRSAGIERDALPRRRDRRARPTSCRRRPSSTALTRNVQQTFSQIVEEVPYLPEELQLAVANIDDPSALCAPDRRVAAPEDRGEAGSCSRRSTSPSACAGCSRCSRASSRSSRSAPRSSPRSSPRSTRSQREYVLRQQLKAIQEELGEFDESAAEANELREQLAAIDLPEEVRKQVDRELGRLEQPAAAGRRARRHPHATWSGSPSLPWDKSTEDNLDLEHAREVLDEDHYDIEQVKDRILEFLAVRKLEAGRARLDPLLRRAARRRQDVARAARSPARWAASSSASASAACATRPRSAATGARTSARCPARSSARCATRAPTTRCS